MCPILGLFLAVFFFSPSTQIWAQQDSSAPFPVNSERQIDQDSRSAVHNGAASCSALLEAVRTAREAMESDRARDAGASDAGVIPSDLRQDLVVLRQSEVALDQCNAEKNPSKDDPVPGIDCSAEQLLNFQVSHDGEPVREIPILRLPDNDAFFFTSGMTIDADGAPNAYHPDNTGLDDLSNAGAPGNWEGLAKDDNGDPFVQGPYDPFPGYFVSATALADRTRPVSDPLRYVDASKIPYIVLPGGMARALGARPGDFAFVLNQRNSKGSFAIFGDVGPFDRIGEGSVALAENLGIRSDARNGGTRGRIQYLVFPGSGNRQPRTVEEISAEGERLLQRWGGSARLAACAVEPPARSLQRIRNTE
jgi:Fungal chitosanase of glycosyl hydrolase group 75